MALHVGIASNLLEEEETDSETSDHRLVIATTQEEEEEEEEEEDEEELEEEEDERERAQSTCELSSTRMSENERKRRFVCRYCLKGFSLMNVLKVHERIHTGERPYTCNVCNKAFNQSGSLNRHKQTHVRRSMSNRYYTCQHCSKQFIHSSQLQAHEATHSNADQQVKLSTRESSSSTSKDYLLTPQQQQQQHHKIANSALVTPVVSTGNACVCDFCSKQLTSEEELKTHRQEHFTMAQFALSAAGMFQGLFSDVSKFFLPPVVTDVAKNYATMAAVNAFQYHAKSEKSSMPFVTSTSLAVKQPLPDLVQQQCHASLSTELLTSKSSLSPNHKAKLKKKDFYHNSLQQNPSPPHQSMAFQQHQKSAPSPIGIAGQISQAYKCAMCMEKFSDSARLHLHMRLHETNEGKKCIECGKQFTCASALKIHFRTHSGERPYTCAFCDKSFSQNGTLKRHHQTCKNAQNWHMIASHGEEDGCLDLSLKAQRVQKCAAEISGMNAEDIAAEEEAVDHELEEEELREAEEADAAIEMAAQAVVLQAKCVGTPDYIRDGVTSLLFSEDCVDGISSVNNMMICEHFSDKSSNSSSSSSSSNGTAAAGNIPICKTSSIDAICAALAEQRTQHHMKSPQSLSINDTAASLRNQAFLSDVEQQCVGQTSLSALVEYLFLKEKLYRCDYCQIFFLDSAMYFLHRSQHLIVGADCNPFTCSACGFEALEKCGFQSHFIDNHGKGTSLSSAQISSDVPSVNRT